MDPDVARNLGDETSQKIPTNMMKIKPIPIACTIVSFCCPLLRFRQSLASFWAVSGNTTFRWRATRSCCQSSFGLRIIIRGAGWPAQIFRVRPFHRGCPILAFFARAGASDLSRLEFNRWRPCRPHFRKKRERMRTPSSSVEAQGRATRQPAPIKKYLLETIDSRAFLPL